MARATLGTPASEISSSEFTAYIQDGESQTAFDQCFSELLDALQPVPIDADSIRVPPAGRARDHDRVGRFSPTSSSLKADTSTHRSKYR
jgi:hypothetical protein